MRELRASSTVIEVLTVAREVLGRLFVLHVRDAYLLLWVAVLFVIFQTPLILSKL